MIHCMTMPTRQPAGTNGRSTQQQQQHRNKKAGTGALLDHTPPLAHGLAVCSPARIAGPWKSRADGMGRGALGRVSPQATHA